jgi:hypothetical protein
MDPNVFLEPKVDLERLSKVLDELGHDGRVWTTRRWDEKQMATLFEAAKGFRALSLADFVPDSVAPLTEVIHEGKNSLPTFRFFQKRFCRPQPDGEANGGASELYGYNESPVGGLVGPGYFVVTQGDTAGEVNIDYRRLPSAKPESWPAIVPNEAKLGRFVYAGMVDVMRGLSSHVTIGRARKNDAFMDAYFVLVRRDAPST